MSAEDTRKVAEAEATKAKELEDSAGQLIERANDDRYQAQKLREADPQNTNIADFEASAVRHEQQAEGERAQASQHRDQEVRLNQQYQSELRDEEEQLKKERDEAQKELKKEKISGFFG